MISETLGADCSVESKRHQWKQFHWWLFRPQRMFALWNPCVTRGTSFIDDFSVPRAICDVESMCHPWNQFRWWFLRPQGCLRCRILASPVEAVSLMICEVTGAVCAVECVTRESIFFDDFWVDIDLVFAYDFWGFRGWLLCRIQASLVEAVSLNISEARGDVCAVKSIRHPWNQFCWWFLSPRGLFALSNPCVTMEAVSLMISKATGAICPVESMHHPWKQFC